MELTTYMATLAAIAALLWAFLKGLGKTPATAKRLAWVVGPVLGVVAHVAGFLDSPANDPLDYMVSAVFGLVATFAAAGGTRLNMLGTESKP